MKVCICNFATQNNQITTNMKKIISLILVFMTSMFISQKSVASESNRSTSSQTVALRVQQKTSAVPSKKRSSAVMTINTYYNAADNTFNIAYDGEAEGEVFLYINNNIIGYDSQINTSLKIPYTRTLRIEIVCDSWIAEGYITI
jgi:copper(I)-binding protein